MSTRHAEVQKRLPVGRWVVYIVPGRPTCVLVERFAERYTVSEFNLVSLDLRYIDVYDSVEEAMFSALVEQRELMNDGMSCFVSLSRPTSRGQGAQA